MNFGEGCDLAGAFWAVVEEGGEFGGYVFCCEAGLEEFGDDAFAGDEVDHGDGEVAVEVAGEAEVFGVVDEFAGEGEGEGGNSVDHDEGIADDRGLDGGGAAGDDGGAGVVEGFGGVGDEGEAEGAGFRAPVAEVFAVEFFNVGFEVAFADG